MENLFKNKKPNFKKMKSFGFSKDNTYKTKILDGEFELCVKVLEDNSVHTELTEISTGELYTLHLIEGAKGTFIGQVREEYQKVLSEIAEKCFDSEIFKEKTTHSVIEYITEKYGDKIECLWEKFPENGIFRRKDNKKWYAAILTVKRDRLGFDSEEIAEVIDLRAAKDDVPVLIKKDNIYPGWHMNKKSWITIILDGSMPLKEICKYIDESYKLAK